MEISFFLKQGNMIIINFEKTHTHFLGPLIGVIFVFWVCLMKQPLHYLQELMTSF